MTIYSVICGIEHALRNEGCNEIHVDELYDRVVKTRGNNNLSLEEFITIIEELERDDLFEIFDLGEGETANSMIARSQMHPSVPIGSSVSSTVLEEDDML